jgi:hypothetical protein
MGGKRPKHMLLRFAGLGDDLFVNTIAYHYWQERGRKVLVAGAHREIFRGNPGVWVVPTSQQKHAHKFGRILEKAGILEPLIYMEYQPYAPRDGAFKPLSAHILKLLADKVGLRDAPKKPVLFLSRDELKKNALPTDGKPWLAMQSSGITRMTSHKNWFPERYAELADRLRHEFRVVQLGLPDDPALDCDLDLRGKISPRAAAAVIASCETCVFQVGYLMHAATAIGARSVIIYGGFEAPWESGYDVNINLFTRLPCSPCWLRGPCPYDKDCMKKIEVNDVIRAVHQVMDERRKTPGFEQIKNQVAVTCR